MEKIAVGILFFLCLFPASFISAETALVMRVIDGDTLEVKMMNTQKTEKVRMIGIDTPELHNHGKKPQWLAREACQRTRELLEGQKIEMESDTNQDNRDKYHRLLRYIFLNGKNINEQLVEEGFAYEYTYDEEVPYDKQSEFQAAEQIAKQERVGLWQ
ncbi:MAG: micrococcal nuclease [Parcubacteria group bacterium Gr01-1014_18]|nr:MAG: micrococcal nuclease [Parcubacteria group bacterium Greene0416_36]TSC80099.1 MAG: micrococcal nuclease [Parcubacteria group bacterium Gr01-1014_18]TSC98611.1 MAG: micrococcal nuclease [Parcubacteria group bacterium Greene1014_20]TSD06438.1 MAG: micrococcal nuclease [Parcubacteria group bacterium Greene0714_2]